MTASRSRTVEAFNTATASTNKVHDDDVARSLGFRGGLVPGVEVHGYLSSLPAGAWGRAWLERGTISTRFGSPVYDGELVVLTGEGDEAGMALTATGPDGTTRATGTATLPDEADAAPAPDPARWPDVGLRRDPPPASPESLAPGTALATAPQRFDAAAHAEYLHDVREDLELYATEGLAHPGWLVRQANKALYANVVLGPWIHVGSAVTNHRAIADGQLVQARALVTDEWEQKGHRFVRLDVAILADGAVAATIDHTAIHRPRMTG